MTRPQQKSTQWRKQIQMDTITIKRTQLRAGKQSNDGQSSYMFGLKDLYAHWQSIKAVSWQGNKMQQLSSKICRAPSQSVIEPTQFGWKKQLVHTRTKRLTDLGN